MSEAKTKMPDMNAGHAGAAIRCVRDGRGAIDTTVVTPAAVAAGDRRRAGVMAPATPTLAHGQEDRTKDGRVGAVGLRIGSLTQHRVCRRLACSATVEGLS